MKLNLRRLALTELRGLYLAGRIDDISIDERLEWREKAKKYLPEFNILDPMEVNQGDTDKEIFELALNNVRKADIILADIRYAEAENTGTASELFLAYTLNKKIIGFSGKKKNNRRRVFMNMMVPEQYETLEEAILAIKLL